jgi:hypothetical protein
MLFKEDLRFLSLKSKEGPKKQNNLTRITTNQSCKDMYQEHTVQKGSNVVRFLILKLACPSTFSWLTVKVSKKAVN